jgi:hypothetical protein
VNLDKKFIPALPYLIILSAEVGFPPAGKTICRWMYTFCEKTHHFCLGAWDWLIDTNLKVSSLGMK